MDYSDADEGALIRKARSGDEDALRELINRHRRLIRQLGVRLGKKLSITDDLIQEGIIAFMTAVIRGYDLTSSNPLWPYAKRVVLSYMWKHMRKYDSALSVDKKTVDIHSISAREATNDTTHVSDEAELERLVYPCMGLNDRSTKWIILFILRDGRVAWQGSHIFAVYADMHGRTEWAMIAQDLRDEHANIGQPVGDGLSIWFCLCHVHRVSKRVPSHWAHVHRLFCEPDRDTGIITPEVNASALRTFFHRGRMELMFCLANKR